jgi:hypothetical protein
MLAMAGRGLNDHIVNPKNIFRQVLALLRSATTPILTNVEVLLPVQSNQYPSLSSSFSSSPTPLLLSLCYLCRD